MLTVRFAVGVLVATMLAGPLFTLPFAARSALVEPSHATANLLAIIALSPLTSLVGAIFAVAPNILGAAAMAWIGARQPWARHWLAWAAAGLALGAALGLLLGKGGPLMLGWTGAACALICRWGTRWDD